MQTEIFLVRHGEPQLQNALLGVTDSSLSERGWTQLEQATSNYKKVDQVITSPLTRCVDFAKSFSHAHEIPLQVQSQWRECDFGDWDGELYQELYDKEPDAVAAFFSDPAKNTPPNGEALVDFSSRTENAMLDLLNQFSGKNILVFSHAGVIRSLVAWCLGIDYLSGSQFRRFAVDYASVTHISVYQDDNIFPQLKCLNWSIESTIKQSRELV